MQAFYPVGLQHRFHFASAPLASPWVRSSILCCYMAVLSHFNCCAMFQWVNHFIIITLGGSHLSGYPFSSIINHALATCFYGFSFFLHFSSFFRSVPKKERVWVKVQEGTNDSWCELLEFSRRCFFFYFPAPKIIMLFFNHGEESKNSTPQKFPLLTFGQPSLQASLDAFVYIEMQK